MRYEVHMAFSAVEEFTADKYNIDDDGNLDLVKKDRGAQTTIASFRYNVWDYIREKA